MHLKCIASGDIFPADGSVLSSPNADKHYSFLDVVYQHEVLPELNTSDKSWRRFMPVLPIKQSPIEFGELQTPLFKVPRFAKQLDLKNVFVKDESQTPSCSFKDRQTFVLINFAAALGKGKVLISSSGNAAISAAAYGLRGGIVCNAVVGRHLPLEKLQLLNFYQANIIQGPGAYEDNYRWSINKSELGWNITAGANPFVEEGLKMIGYEIWEQIGVPDCIVIPCGNGSLLYGVYKAFRELKAFGLTNVMPKMIGVQMQGAAPLKASWSEKQAFLILPTSLETVAESIEAAESFASPKVMLALRETNGEMVEVNNDEVIQALKEIIQCESIIPEPTSASVYAATKKINIDKDEKVVLLNTAGGMKNLHDIKRLSSL